MEENESEIFQLLFGSLKKYRSARKSANGDVHINAAGLLSIYCQSFLVYFPITRTSHSMLHAYLEVKP